MTIERGALSMVYSILNFHYNLLGEAFQVLHRPFSLEIFGEEACVGRNNFQMDTIASEVYIGSDFQTRPIKYGT